MKFFHGFATLLLLVLVLVAPPVVAQTQLVSDSPAVQTAINEVVQQVRATANTAQKQETRFTPMGGGNGGPSGLPPVALLINRLQFEEGQQLQTSLLTLQGNYLSTVRVVRSMIYIGAVAGGPLTTRTGSFFATLVPGEAIAVQNYIFDGSEAAGLYIYVVVLLDPWDNPIAQAAATFIFRTGDDGNGYARIETAEARGEWTLNLRGTFFRTDLPPIGMGQWVVIGRLGTFPVLKATNTEATVDLGSRGLPAGIYDLTLIVRRDGNISYDSTTAPGALRVYRPRPPQPVISQ